MAVIVGESSGVVSGEAAFDLMSNRCDFFEIGEEAGEDVWLQGVVAGDEGQEEFVFNGRLFSKNGGSATLIDGFPKSDPPAGWSKHPDINGDGWELRDEAGETVFGFSKVDNICFVKLGLHNADGAFAAIPGQGGLITNNIKVQIGTGSGAIKIS